jgi:predicted dehydrogenase
MMGRHHVRVLDSMAEVDLVAVADPNGDRYASVADLEPYPSTQELLKAEELDLCVIATPTVSHCDAALQLAAQGVATLIEKPLAPTVQECDQILEGFSASGTTAAVGHIERFNPAILALRDQIDRNTIGNVLQIATRRQGPRPSRIGDVGVAHDLATHDFDLVSWIGGADYTRMNADVRSRTNSSSADLLVASGKLETGVLVSHVVNWCSPVKERVTVVTGEQGTLVADTLTVDLIVHAPGRHEPEWDAIRQGRGVSEGDVTRLAIPKREPLVAELEAFCAAVRGTTSPVASLAEGRRAVELADQCLLKP